VTGRTARIAPVSWKVACLYVSSRCHYHEYVNVCQVQNAGRLKINCPDWNARCLRIASESAADFRPIFSVFCAASRGIVFMAGSREIVRRKVRNDRAELSVQEAGDHEDALTGPRATCTFSRKELLSLARA
jgi:hypothetical protein